MPPDVKLTPIDRHIAPPASLVDEFFEFTHSQPMDWMLPGEPRTLDAAGTVGRGRFSACGGCLGSGGSWAGRESMSRQVAATGGVALPPSLR